MPISDEVIELAPVKKTKKTLIIMIACMGVLFALAVAFLVMYLIKPSVTEDTNHVKDITLVSTELFSETDSDGNVKYYASIGNEYTVYSTLTVDNNSSTNVQWDCDPALLDIKEQSNTGEPFLKFIPKVGMHGKTAKITVRAPSQVSAYKTIEFIIVNQGAVDIQVTQYGVRGNPTPVIGDNKNEELLITVPYYTMNTSSNNQPVQVRFNQISKYNPTSGEYLKPTSVLLDGHKTDYVTVTSSDPSVISIDENTITNEGFSFTAKKSTNNNQFVTITITANAYNGDFDEVTKTIKVKVDSNIMLGYVDSMYVFNKPIVDAAFIGKVLADNKESVDAQKLRTEIGKDKSLKYVVYNDRLVPSMDDFALILPYSNNSSVTYNDIFKHVLLNPASIQYDGKEISTAWYKNVTVTSSESSVIQVTTESSGGVKLCPQKVAPCVLTLKDKKQGSAGAEIKVPVRIVAQTEKAVLAYGNNSTSPTDPDIEVVAAVNNSYDVNVTYTFIAPNRDKPNTLLEENCLNNVFKLDFVGGDDPEMEVKLKGTTEKLKPNTEYKANFDKIEKLTGGTEKSTRYTATLTFEVTVKMDTTGAAVFKFIKDGPYIYDEGGDSLYSKDKAIELSASFGITESAECAWIVKAEDDNGKGNETLLNLVTNNGDLAGKFVRTSDTDVSIYLQNQTDGELTIVSEANLHKFVRADKSFFKINNVNTVATIANYLSRDSKTGVLSFADRIANVNVEAGRVTFDVHNNKTSDSKIASLTIRIFLIDAVTDIIPVNTQQSKEYSAELMGTLTVTDVNVERYFEKTSSSYDYSDVELYYNKGTVKFVKETDDDGNYIFKHQGRELYKFDKREHKLSTLTDIYAYSYEKGVNFGNVELEFLINAEDEYIGKNFDQEFIYKHKTKIEFVRKADRAALFADSDYETAVSYDVTNGFNVSVNQDTDAFLYATSVIDVTLSNGSKSVYIEKEDGDGHVAPVQSATFSLPTGIIPSTSIAPSIPDRYYSVTYRSPAITKEKEYYGPSTVYYGDKTDSLKFTVNNVTRRISSIGIYSDEACTTGSSLAGKSLLFGGFINQANKYSNTVYVKVEYENHQSSFTSFEGAELTLPSYLKLGGGKTPAAGTNTYTLAPASYSSNNNHVVHTCTIVLDKDEEITDIKTVKVSPSTQKDGNKEVSFTADVQAGLNRLTVKNGDTTIATITAGNTGTRTIPFDLANPSDKKSLNLSFEYEATNSENYALAYDHTGAGLKVGAPTVMDGYSIINNIQSAASEFTIATTNSIATGKKTFAFTFTDEYNGADANNIFALEIEITVTMDIYELAFADGTSTAVTVTGAASGAQTLSVTVKYNGDNATTQPSATVIKTNDVLGVYLLNGKTYEAFEGGITVTRAASDATGKTYTVSIPNNIDRNKTYYLRLVYGNVTYNGDIHLRSIIISTLTSHIVYDANNSIKPAQVEGEPCPTASIVAQSASDTFTLVANVVNDGSDAVESDKTAGYGLYTEFDGTTPASGITVNNGVIKVTNPTKITDTVYYRATYTDSNTHETYTLKVKLTYTVAPSAVKISGVDEKAFNAANKTLVLYLGNDSYTQADLRGKITAETAFTNASYGSENVVYGIALQDAADSAYLDVAGFVLTPKALNGNVKTTVPVVITATYAGKEVEEIYNVEITPVADLALAQSSGTLNLLNRNSQLTVTPTVGAYNGFAPTYTLTADDGLFNITGSGNEKTVKLADNTCAQRCAYMLTATVSYAYSVVANGGITAVGTFASSKTYTVNVVGDYTLAFDLMAGNDVISPYVSTDDTTKYPVVNESLSYSVKVTSADTGFVTTSYGATVTPNVVSVAAFSGKTAAVSLIDTASGAFAITVTATVGGQTYTLTKNYYFMYGANIAAKLYISNDGGSTYTEFSGASQNIDYDTTPYQFKYEITGVPENGTANFVVNGNVSTSVESAVGDKRTCIITTSRPTTMRIGASVTIGSRTVYMPDKEIRLTAIAPNFTFNPAATVLPAGTIELSVGNDAENFNGRYNAQYSVISGGAYATISGSTLAANSNVVTDQTVIVRAKVTVQNGVYAGEYVIDKAITITGVALPTIRWEDTANKVLCLKDQGNYSYSENDYTFANNGSYDYTGKVDITITAANGTLILGTDFSYNAGNNTVTLSDNIKTKAGGSLRLTVTAAITSGAHVGESVSDTITVRVLPTMSTSVSNIALGNAAAAYDLNGTAYKSVFAPNTNNSGTGFVKSTDNYSIISLSVDNTTNFDVDGAKLIVKNDLTTATTVQVTATVLITSGEYAGTTVVGTKNANISVPPARTENVQWNDTTYKYDDITLTRTKVLGSAITGEVSGITVVVPDAVAEYVTVANNGTASPVVTVSKDYGAYFTATAPDKTFTVNYVVTLTNGNVYYSTATYNVATQNVHITATLGGDAVAENGAVSVNSGEILIMQLSADNGFDVVVTNVTVTPSNSVNTTYGGNGIQFDIGSVNSNQDVSVALALKVAGQPTTFEFGLTILAPLTNAQYTADNTDITGFAVNINNEITQNNTVVSTWTAASNARYKYAQSVTITAPNGHTLNEYFETFKLNDSRDANLNGNSATIDFPVTTVTVWGANSTRRILTESFNLNMTINTRAAIPLSTIEVKFTVYNSDNRGSSIDVIVLYKVQVIGEVAVTLNANAGDDNVQVNYTNPLYKHSYNLPTPTRTGYTLDGWYTAEKGGSRVANNATVTNTQPHTLYARWTAKTYNLQYNANYTDASAISATKTVTYGQTYGELNTPTRTGYDFVGWTAESGANSQVITADTLVKPANADVSAITLYAQWRIRYYTVTLDENYTGGSVFTFQVPYGQSFNVHNSFRPARDGYRFDGWNVSGDVTNVTSNVTMTARWIKLYTVSFDLNNDESIETYTSLPYDENAVYGTLPTPANTATKNFTGWKLADGTAINSTSQVTGENADITLFAQWTNADSYTVTFNSGVEGLAVTPASKIVYKNRAYGELPTLTRARYTFNGWYTEATGGSEVTSATVVNLTANQTLHAQWTQVECLVTLNAGNDGTVMGETSYSFTVSKDAQFSTYLNVTPTRTGYRFDGWYNSENEKQTVAITVTGDVTLTAKWIKLYTVSFDLDNDESTETYASIPYDENAVYGTLPTPANTATKNFTGWARTRNGSVINGATATVTGENADITLYAQWTNADSYTVTFDSCVEGLTVDPATKTVYKGRTYGELPTLTRARYTFNGWYTEATGGNEVTSATVVNLTSNQTLHAQWTQVVFTVTLDAGDGTVLGDNSTYDTNVATGQSYDLHLMITPTRDGYRFDGWWINGVGEEADVKQESAITVTDDVTLTAHWTANTYSVTFDLNGNMTAETPNEITVTYGQAYGELPTLDDYTDGDTTYTFAGWYKSADGDDNVTSATIVSTIGGHTLHAHWTEVTEEPTV